MQMGGQVECNYPIGYWFADTISGKSASSQRPAFMELMTKIRDGSFTVPLKLHSRNGNC